jgi:hypothetical protein
MTLPQGLWSLLEAAGMAAYQVSRWYSVVMRYDEAALRMMVGDLAEMQLSVWYLAEQLAELLGEDVDVGRLAVELAETQNGRRDDDNR